MQLIEVNSPRLARDFIRVNVELYRGDPNYIRPLDKDIHEIFDPSHNKSFRFGEAARWVLRDKEGTPLKAHPAVKIVHDNEVKMFKLLREFRMTPKGREKLHKEKPPRGEPDGGWWGKTSFGLRWRCLMMRSLPGWRMIDTEPADRHRCLPCPQQRSR